MKLQFSPDAVADIIEYEALIRRDNPLAAEQWTENIFEHADRLLNFPNSGRIVPEFNRPDLREVLVHSHRVVYRIRGNSVQIVRVYHSARLLRESDLGEE